MITSLLAHLILRRCFYTHKNENLEELIQSIFNKEFISIADLPKGWKKGSLLDIAEYKNGLAMQKYRPKENEKPLPVLKIKELRQGFCDLSSELCSSTIKNDYLVQDGDVIFSWSGSLLVDFWSGGNCGLNQHLFKITSKKYDKWFYFMWTKYHLQKFISTAADMATTMGHIKRQELEKVDVLIPCSSDYERIRKLLNPLFNTMVTSRIQNKNLILLRDGLLQKLMTTSL